MRLPERTLLRGMRIAQKQFWPLIAKSFAEMLGWDVSEEIKSDADTIYVYTDGTEEDCLNSLARFKSARPENMEKLLAHRLLRRKRKTIADNVDQENYKKGTMEKIIETLVSINIVIDYGAKNIE